MLNKVLPLLYRMKIDIGLQLDRLFFISMSKLLFRYRPVTFKLNLSITGHVLMYLLTSSTNFEFRRRFWTYDGGCGTLPYWENANEAIMAVGPVGTQLSRDQFRILLHVYLLSGR